MRLSARRFAAPLALAAALCLAVAAPYLTPIDPDSAVFRSGALGAFLVLAAYFPVRRAFERHGARALGFGAAFALIFGICLGTGSELTVYERLLPGMGALLRRAAVPALALPALTALFSYPFQHAPAAGERRARVPFWAYFALLAACYGAVLLALFPGVISYDFAHEMEQLQSGVFEAAHPVFHTLLLGALYALGEKLFGSMTAGAALYSAAQLLLLAAAYAAVLRFCQSRVSRAATALLAAGFALLPFHGVLAVSTAKDPLFAGACALLCMQLWAFSESPDDFLGSRGRRIALALTCLALALLRHNGVFALLPALLALPCLSRTRRAALTAALTLLMCLAVPAGLGAALHAERTPGAELMSVPCQQLMRTAAVGGVTEEEFDELNGWFSGQAVRYRPHIADPAKGNFDYDRFARDPAAFLQTYLRYARKYPRVYLEAFLENGKGLWDPGDTSHAHALSGEQYDFIYLNTVYPFAPEDYPIEPRSLLPALGRALYAFMHTSVHEKYAFLAQLFCPAVYVFALLLATLLAFFKRRRALAAAMLPLWGIALSILFSAGVLVRYAYPIMAAAPPLLALVLYAPKRDEGAA